MKSVVCIQFGEPELLVIREAPSVIPGPSQVVVAVHAAAVNFPDTLIIQGRYQFRPEPPFIPGSEAAGVITRVGPGVAEFAPGDRVSVMQQWGVFAEEILVDAERLIKLPAGVSMDDAASLLLTYGTSHYALKHRASLRPGETLLVLGAAGGTGLSAVELGKAMGARVLAAASSDQKLALCRARGADACINYATNDLREQLGALTGGRGVDVVYDPVGGLYTEPCLRSLSWQGRLLVVGFATGQIPQLPTNLALLKGVSIVGVFYGSFVEREPQRYRDDVDEIYAWLQDGRIRPLITARFALEDAAIALRTIADRQAVGKILLTTEAGRCSGASAQTRTGAQLDGNPAVMS